MEWAGLIAAIPELGAGFERIESQSFLGQWLGLAPPSTKQARGCPNKSGHPEEACRMAIYCAKQQRHPADNSLFPAVFPLFSGAVISKKSELIQLLEEDRWRFRM
jgi:hypothetical protein